MIIKSIVVLFIVQAILLIVPTLFHNMIINLICLAINMILTFIIIKGIEKKYYKKYDRLASMLYNLCPLLGVSIIFIVIYQLSKQEAIKYLLEYYIPLFIGIYLINIMYLVIVKFTKK